MFWRFVLSAVKFRRRRLLLAFSGLAVAATLATTLLSVYSDIDRKMRHEFRGYGANLIVAPGLNSHSVPLAAVDEAERLGAVAAPFLYVVERVAQERLVVAGVDFRRAAPLTSYWHVDGARTAGPGECLAGSALAAHFRVGIGQTVPLASGPCIVRGIVSTGGPEDDRLMVPFERAAADAGFQDAASLIEVRADGPGKIAGQSRVQEVRAALAAAVPGVDVSVLYAVAETEANVVLKVKSAVFFLALAIFGITTLCVTGNFSALVIERSKEIGLLKAIGAAESKIASLFLSESLVLALASALTGYVLGLAIAYGIGRKIFSDAAVGVDFGVFMPVITVTLLVAIIATLLASSRIWRIEPAMILRGE
ncbi:MAG TPA: FtsX-like permease family protein [Bryobacteraceae bacterium]|nr:FtsX-like permease family protein [Bryobacteraceae bacterium]